MTPSVDFNVAAIEIMPPKKRLPKFIAWILGLYSGLVYLNEVFEFYMNGFFGTSFAPGEIYSIGQYVKYKRKVYVLSYPVDVSYPNPDSSPSWRLVLDNFIGTKERSRYRVNKIILEYAINRYFESVFRQPPLQSDIYITNLTYVEKSFTVFSTEKNTSSIYTTGSDGEVYSTELFGVVSSYIFIVHIPSSVYLNLGSADVAETIIREFLNKYVPPGIYYQITTY